MLPAPTTIRWTNWTDARRIWIISAVLIGGVFFYKEHDLRISLSPTWTPWSDDGEAVLRGGNAIKGLALGALGLWGAFLCVLPSRRRLRPMVLPIVLGVGYVIWAGLSVFWSDDPSSTLKGWVVLASLGVCVGGIARHLSARDTSKLIASISLSYLAVGFLAELALGRFRPWDGEWRFAGTIHPNAQGALLGLTVVSLAYLAFDHRIATRLRYVEPSEPTDDDLHDLDELQNTEGVHDTDGLPSISGGPEAFDPVRSNPLDERVRAASPPSFGSPSESTAARTSPTPRTPVPSDLHGFQDAPRPTTAWPTQANRFIRAIPFLIVAAFVALVLTKSRTCTAGTLVSVALLTFIVSRWGTRAVLLVGGAWTIAVAGIGAILAGVDLEKKLLALGLMGRVDDSSALTGRLPIWIELTHYIRERPITGYGFSSFWTIDRIEAISREMQWTFREAHNFYIECLLWTGVVGLGLLSATVLTAVASAAMRVYAARLRGQIRTAAANAFVITAMVATAILGITESGSLHPSIDSLLLTALVFQVLLGTAGDPADDRPRSAVASPSVQAAV